jgi:hypothetical protein
MTYCMVNGSDLDMTMTGSDVPARTCIPPRRKRKIPFHLPRASSHDVMSSCQCVWTADGPHKSSFLSYVHTYVQYFKSGS